MKALREEFHNLRVSPAEPPGAAPATQRPGPLLASKAAGAVASRRSQAPAEAPRTPPAREPQPPVLSQEKDPSRATGASRGRRTRTRRIRKLGGNRDAKTGRAPQAQELAQEQERRQPQNAACCRRPRLRPKSRSQGSGWGTRLRHLRQPGLRIGTPGGRQRKEGRGSGPPRPQQQPPRPS